MNNISNIHIDDLISSKLKPSSQIINKQSDALPNQNDFSKASANTDTFEKSQNGSDINSIGLYNKSLNAKSDIVSSEVIAVQSANSTNSTSNYYNVIKNKAAQKAGATVSSNGDINIPGPSAAYAYQAELKRIEGTFWCQTGGWSNLNGDGSTECCRTAVATMASINSGTIVTPNDTGSDTSSVTVNGTKYSWKCQYNYDFQAGAEQGLTLYDLNSESDLIAAINNELKNNRTVVVKTTVHNTHWVTVTGTKNGKPATSFDDFIGVDPWYNGNNENNPSPSTGLNATSSQFSGVITLSSVSNQNLHSDYRMYTFR